MISSPEKVSWWNILFGFRDGYNEKRFIIDYFDRFKVQVRFGLLISIFIYLVFYFIDINVFPELEPKLIVNRLLVSGIFAMILGVSFTKVFARHMQWFLLFFGLVAAVGILWKLRLLNQNGYDFSFFYPGLILTSAIVTFYLRVRFVHSALLNVFVIAAYILVFWVCIEPIPSDSPINLTQTFINSLFFIVGSSLLSLYAAYYLEKMTRNDFLAQQHINYLNDHLQDEVQQRTAELREEKRKNINLLLDGQEKERKRISKELHDSVGCQLALVKMNLEAQQQAQDYSGLSQSIGAVTDLIKDVRDISHNHSVFVLQRVGLTNAIESSLYQILPRSCAHFNVYFHRLNGHLSSAAQLMLYRVFQEALNNILKHSEATEVDIQLVQHDQQVSMVICDNGKGFDVNDAHHGLWMHNMRMRIENQLEGELIIDSRPGYGTTLIATIKSEEL
jgi:signal transduction histidine kinase